MSLPAMYRAAVYPATRSYRLSSAILMGTLLMGSTVMLGCQQQAAQQPTEQAPIASKAGDLKAADSKETDSKPWTTPQSSEDSNSIDRGGAAADRATPPTTLSLFDGKTLTGWQVTNFGSEGDCSAEDGKLVISAGYPLSGVTSTRDDLPTTNYEVSLESRRTLGSDFFCGLTFPVAASHCTLIVGGWSGPVVGLSCIDDLDAVNNESLRVMKFETNQWYKIKVRVQPQQIQAWIDDELVVDQDIEGRKISVRQETLPTRPLGICTFETTSQCKNIQLRHLTVVP